MHVGCYYINYIRRTCVLHGVMDVKLLYYGDEKLQANSTDMLHVIFFFGNVVYM